VLSRAGSTFETAAQQPHMDAASATVAVRLS
jgi:hypothetical protein